MVVEIWTAMVVLGDEGGKNYLQIAKKRT